MRYVTGICLVGDIVYAMIWFDTNKPNRSFGYGFMMLFIISPILFFEFIGTLIAAIIKSKKPQNNAAYGAYAYP